MSYFASGDIASLAVIPEGGRSGTGPGGAVQDFGVFVNAFTATNVVVDIVGYYTQPAATALQCTYPTNASTAMVVASGDSFQVSVPACPTGYARTGSGCYSQNKPSQVRLLESSVNNSSDCVWQNLLGFDLNALLFGFAAESACCRVPGH